MPSPIPRLITNISGSAGEPVASFPPNRSAASREGNSLSDVPGLSAKIVRTTSQDRNRLLGDQTKTFFPRPGRSMPVQIRQALLLRLTYNLCRSRHCLRLRGCQQSLFKSFRIRSYKKTPYLSAQLYSSRSRNVAQRHQSYGAATEEAGLLTTRLRLSKASLARTAPPCSLLASSDI